MEIWGFANEKLVSWGGKVGKHSYQSMSTSGWQGHQWQSRLDWSTMPLSHETPLNGRVLRRCRVRVSYGFLTSNLILNFQSMRPNAHSNHDPITAFRPLHVIHSPTGIALMLYGNMSRQFSSFISVLLQQSWQSQVLQLRWCSIFKMNLSISCYNCFRSFLQPLRHISIVIRRGDPRIAFFNAIPTVCMTARSSRHTRELKVRRHFFIFPVTQEGYLEFSLHLISVLSFHYSKVPMAISPCSFLPPLFTF